VEYSGTSTGLARVFELLVSRRRQEEIEKVIEKKWVMNTLAKQNVLVGLMRGMVLRLMRIRISFLRICISVGSKACFI
jgi:hypothetical protein